MFLSYFRLNYLIRIWKRLTPKEKVWFGVFTVVILFSISFLIGDFYRSRTRKVPVSGGAYVEGIAEPPHSINPILATNDADRDLSRLIFSSLVKYNEKGELVPDLASSWQVSKDGKTYTIKLKNGVRWHDGEPFSSEDVIFTINAAQNPDYASPLRSRWQGVRFEALDKNTLIITLKTPYAAFIENLALLGILPRHVWKAVAPQNFPLAEFNLKPIGTGPYKFVKLQKDSLGRITLASLAANQNYFLGAPLIKNVTLKFYSSEEEAVSAFNRKEIDGLLLQTAQSKNQLRGLENSSVFSLPSPRVYAVFLNTDDKILKDKNVRLAVNYAVNRKELLEKLLNGDGKVAFGPIPPGLIGSSPDIAGYNYNPEKTKEILKKNGWVKDETGIYGKKFGKDKEPTALRFSIITTGSIRLAATFIRDNLKDAGIDSELKITSVGELQQIYRTKNYSAIFIGEAYTNSADPYVFWHGAAIKDAGGLNLSLYNNRKVNKILEDLRSISDPVKKSKKLEDFQKLIISDAPAVFVYSPNYVYIMKKGVQSANLEKLILPSERFSRINEWNVETERVLK